MSHASAHVLNGLPVRPLVQLHTSFFAVFGAPIAWFIQLCADYALASEPCFRDGHRSIDPLPQLIWTGPAMIAIMIAAILVAALSFLASWRAFSRARAFSPADISTSKEASRTRFLALWGMAFGGGFALAAALSTVALLTLPRCAG
jgi:hypothetical protein